MTIDRMDMDNPRADLRRARMRRAAVGAFYGLLGGSAFVTVAGLIDIWLNPGLPLGVNWDAVALRLPLIALGLALVGALTCWWDEAWQGLVGGAVAASALALAVALFTSQVGAGLKVVVLVFILVPVAAMTLPLAYLLRWLVERHARALQGDWAAARILGLVLLTATLAGGAGYFMKTPERGIESSRFIHALLQDLASAENPLAEVAGVPERSDAPYVLVPTASPTSTEGWDIRVRFDDGYRLMCKVILYPGRNPFFDGCTVGDAD